MGEIPELKQREDTARVKASTGQIFNSIWDGSYFIKLPISSDTHCRRARNCNSLHFGHNKLHLRRAYCCPLTNMGLPEMQTFTVKELKDFFRYYKQEKQVQLRQSKTKPTENPFRRPEITSCRKY